ncbi:MAG: hypothetical protein KBD19_04115 [Candidatus Moranbacteria bacterium]|nr:hypothetical protein [Candidatus Moranbacteria bacterium]
MGKRKQKQRSLFNEDELKRQAARWSKTRWGSEELAKCAVIDPVGSGLPGGRLAGIATRKRRLPAAE